MKAPVAKTCQHPRLVDLVRAEIEDEFVNSNDRSQLRQDLHELALHTLQWIDDLDGPLRTRI